MKAGVSKFGAGLITLIGLCADIIGLYSYFRVTSGLPKDITAPLYLSITDINQLLGMNFMLSRLVEVGIGIVGLFVLGVVGLNVLVAFRVERGNPLRAVGFVVQRLLVVVPLIILWGHLRWGWIPVRSTFLVIEISIIWLIFLMTAFKRLTAALDTNMGCLLVLFTATIFVPFVAAYVFAGWSLLQSVGYSILACLLGIWLVDATD